METTKSADGTVIAYERTGDGPAVLLDTPYGFQANADELSAKAGACDEDRHGRRPGPTQPPAARTPVRIR